ncbi:MAG: hypothetical protein FWF50_03725 [Defluviitaleaceae bacterium]|nr:hypothetical protein [Defluviitaleaceae bacterium]
MGLQDVFILFVIVDISLVLLGIVSFLAGFKLIRIIHLFTFGFLGFMLGFLIGEVLQIELLAYIFGIGLCMVFAYFCFVHHKYLKGLTLGVLAFLLFLFLSSLFLTGTFTLIIFSSVLTIVIVSLNYIFERIVTILFTSLLGSVLILTSPWFDFEGFAFLSLVIGGFIISCALQLLLLKKWHGYI